MYCFHCIYCNVVVFIQFIFHQSKFQKLYSIERTLRVIRWKMPLKIREFPRDERLGWYWEKFTPKGGDEEEIEEESKSGEERVSSVCASAVRDA